MSMLDRVTICKQLVIHAGHRLLDHDGPCRFLHGHEYWFDVHCSAPELDSVGRVIDFKFVKEKVGKWLHDAWDHGMIINSDDPLLPWFAYEDVKVTIPHASPVLVPSPLYGQKYYPIPCNPTAENLAKYLKRVANGMLMQHEIKCFRVDCHETYSCTATAED